MCWRTVHSLCWRKSNPVHVLVDGPCLTKERENLLTTLEHIVGGTPPLRWRNSNDETKLKLSRTPIKLWKDDKTNKHFYEQSLEAWQAFLKEAEEKNKMSQLNQADESSGNDAGYP